MDYFTPIYRPYTKVGCVRPEKEVKQPTYPKKSRTPPKNIQTDPEGYYITIYDQLPARHPIPRATKLTMFQLDDRLMVFEGSSNIDNKNGQKKWPLLSGVTWAPINGGNSGETKPYL